MTLGIDTNAIEDVKNDNLSIKGREDVRIFHIPNWNSDSVAEVKPDKAKELNSKHTVRSVNTKEPSQRSPPSSSRWSATC